MRSKRKNNLSFTLLELVVVVIIMGILATLAIPTFNRLRESSLDNEARSSLRLIQQAQMIYNMTHGFYYPAPAASETNITRINDHLKLSLNEQVWDYVTFRTGRSTAARNGRTWTMNIGNANPTCAPAAACF